MMLKSAYGSAVRVCGSELGAVCVVTYNGSQHKRVFLVQGEVAEGGATPSKRGTVKGGRIFSFFLVQQLAYICLTSLS